MSVGFVVVFDIFTGGTPPPPYVCTVLTYKPLFPLSLPLGTLM